MNYYRDYEPRNAPLTKLFSERYGATQGVYYCPDGFLSNGFMCILGGKVAGYNYDNCRSTLDSFDPYDYKTPVTIKGEYYRGLEFWPQNKADKERQKNLPHLVHCQCEEQGQAAYNAAFFDIVLTAFPYTKPFVCDKLDEYKPLWFKDDTGKAVALVMPYPGQLERLPDWVKIAGLPEFENKI